MAQSGSYPAKLGIIAGGGVLPEKLARFCEKQRIESFVVAFDGHTDPDLVKGRDHLMTRLADVGRILKTLRSRGISDLVFIGAIKRPRLRDLRPDFFTACFLAKIGFQAFGDDGLLQAIRVMLEQEGFRLHGIHDFLPDLLMPAGVLGRHAPSDSAMVDIRYGFRVAKTLGQLDVGQSVVVQDGVVLGVEGVEGTNALLQRCASYRPESQGFILIKTCKPQQDKRLDMPTIGPDTIASCVELGYQGIAVEAGSTLVVDLEHVVSEADYHGLFLIGLASDDPEISV